MTIINLNARKREKKDSSSRKLKIKGEIPAIYYAKNTPSIPIKLDHKQMQTLLNSPVGLIKLQIDSGTSLLAVAKEIQKDPVTHTPIHLSFEGIKEGETFHISLPVRIEHSEDCKWMREKGVVVQKSNHLQIEVLPKKLPEAIVVNIDHLEIGDVIHVGDLKYPDIKFLDNPQTEVVSVTYVKIVEEPVVEAAVNADPLAAAAENEGAGDQNAQNENGHHKDQDKHNNHKK